MEKNNFTKIDAYLNNELSAEEKTTFEKAMQQDTALQKEVKVYQLERKAAKALLKNNFREKVVPCPDRSHEDNHLGLQYRR